MTATNPLRLTPTLIRYPRFDSLHATIRECQAVSQTAGEPLCLCLEGPTGAGKTTLVKSYTQAFPRLELAEQTHIPVFYMETPHPVTVKGMAAAMLAHLGDPAAHKGTLWSMNTRLVHFLRVCRVQLVILDDFHHLVDRKTNRILCDVADWLKVLIKQTHIPYLVIGVDDEVARILKANRQLSRLFLREQLQPFQWDVQTPATIEQFAAFISYATHTLDIDLPTDMARADLLYRLHYATDGVIGYIMYLLDKVNRLSAESSAQVTMAMLAAAYEQRLKVHVDKPNPFLSREMLPPHATTVPVDDPAGVTRRGHAMQPTKPSVAAVLSKS